MSDTIIKEVMPSGGSTSVKIIVKGGKVSLEGTARVLVKQNGSSQSCYITGLDIYFKAKDEQERKKKTLMFVKFYLDNFLMFSSKNGLRKLALDLNKKGFRAENHNTIMYQLVNNKVISANFKPVKSKEPNDFAGAEEISEHFERAA